jgi:hypothetical protein
MPSLKRITALALPLMLAGLTAMAHSAQRTVVLEYFTSTT